MSQNTYNLDSYNGFNGGWPSARLFGWSAADWSRPATNKSISLERRRKSQLFCWERKSWTSWLLTCCSKKGWAAEKSSKKGVNRNEKCFLSSSAHKLDDLGKIKEHAPLVLNMFIFPRALAVTYTRPTFKPATLLPQLSKYAPASGVYLHCA